MYFACLSKDVLCCVSYVYFTPLSTHGVTHGVTLVFVLWNTLWGTRLPSNSGAYFTQTSSFLLICKADVTRLRMHSNKTTSGCLSERSKAYSYTTHLNHSPREESLRQEKAREDRDVSAWKSSSFFKNIRAALIHVSAPGLATQCLQVLLRLVRTAVTVLGLTLIQEKPHFLDSEET